MQVVPVQGGTTVVGECSWRLREWRTHSRQTKERKSSLPPSTQLRTVGERRSTERDRNVRMVEPRRRNTSAEHCPWRGGALPMARRSCASYARHSFVAEARERATPSVIAIAVWVGRTHMPKRLLVRQCSSRSAMFPCRGADPCMAVECEVDWDGGAWQLPCAVPGTHLVQRLLMRMCFAFAAIRETTSKDHVRRNAVC